MRTCNTFCIANVCGKCAVQDCRGPVERIGQKPDFDLELAAKFYKFSMDAFDDFFADDKKAILGEACYYLEKLIKNRKLNP